MKKLLLAAALAAGFAVSAATPTVAQDLAYTPGSFTAVQGIFVEDGQMENYMDYIAATYRRSQDFARQRGWITGYRIFQNVNRRSDEPHLYLLVEMPRLATPQEQVQREEAVAQMMSQTSRQLEAASGQRVTMRRLGSNLLLQELNLRPAR